MRILHVINSIEIGGAESFLFRLIKAQEKLGYTCYILVVAPHLSNPDYLNYCKVNSNIEFLELFQEKTTLFSKILYKIDQILKTKLGLNNKLKQERNYYQNLLKYYYIEIVNSHLLSADKFVYEKMAKNFKVNWILTSQGCYNEHKDVNLIKKMIPYIDGMTYVAEKNLKIFNQSQIALTNNKKLIFNGLDKNINVGILNKKDFRIDDNDFVLGQITRSIPEKGMEISILATLALIERGYYQVKLILMGPVNEYYLSLKNKYQSAKILFLGSTNDPIAYINLFNLGLLPSYFPSESCPSTIVEYLAGNVPVVATNIGEIPNMINFQNKLSGTLVQEKDAYGLPSVDAFVNAIEQYLKDKTLYEKHKNLCKDAFEKFDMNLIVKEYEKIYTTCLNK